MKKTQTTKVLINFESGNVLHDNVLIEPVEIHSSSLVAVADGYEDKKEWGVVLAVGPGRVLPNGNIHTVSVKVGDIVLYEKYSTRKIRKDGKDFFFIRDEDIIYKQ